MLKFDMSDLYKGTGVSRGLDRGLLVYDDDVQLLEEGMGLGACALQTGGRTYFASIKDIKMVGNLFDVKYSIDMKLELEILRIKSQLITLAQEYLITNIYMRHAKRQEQLLKFGAVLRKLFNLKTCFVKVPSLGEVRIRYELGNGDILVGLCCELEKIGGKLFVMNELGGSIFDKSIVNGKLSNAPSGWQKMKNPCKLYSSTHSLSFSIDERYVPDNVKSELYWGREQVTNHCCWAGFEIEILCESGKFNNYIYSITLKGDNEEVESL